MNNRSYSYTRLQNYASDWPSGSPSSRNGGRKKLHDKTVSDSSSSGEESDKFSPMKLRRIRSGISVHSTPDLHRDIVEHSIQPNETLQGIALQYRCSVFDLKRVNGIVNDTEFFAFRMLKIPVALHSALKESPLSPATKTENLNPENIDKNNRQTDFLQQVDEDLQKLKERAKTYEIQAAETVEDFENPTIIKPSKRFDCRGDDCGLSWLQVVGLALLVLLCFPLLYFLHLELEKHEKSSNVAVNETLNS